MSLYARGGQWHWEQVINGTRHRKATGVPVKGKAERALAERRAGEFANDARGENFGYEKPKVPTVRNWWKHYAETHLKLKGERTQRRDTGTMTLHAVPYFGDKLLDKVTKSDCVAYMQMRRESYAMNPGRKTVTKIAEGTVMRERQLLQAVWQKAIDDNIITANPWRGIKTGRYKVRDRVLMPDEQHKLLAVLLPRYRRFVTVMLETGCRLDEIRNVDPAKDMNLHERTMMVLGKGRKLRQVTLSKRAVENLRKQMEEDGRLWTQTAAHIRDMLQRAAKRAGIDHVSPHVLRHTFGHRWLKSGGNIFVLSRMLGHGSVMVTQAHYAHLLREDFRDAIDARELGAGTAPAAAPPPLVTV